MLPPRRSYPSWEACRYQQDVVHITESTIKGQGDAHSHAVRVHYPYATALADFMLWT